MVFLGKAVLGTMTTLEAAKYVVSTSSSSTPRNNRSHRSSLRYQKRDWKSRGRERKDVHEGAILEVRFIRSLEMQRRSRCCIDSEILDRTRQGSSKAIRRGRSGEEKIKAAVLADRPRLCVHQYIMHAPPGENGISMRGIVVVFVFLLRPLVLTTLGTSV